MFYVDLVHVYDWEWFLILNREWDWGWVDGIRIHSVPPLYSNFGGRDRALG